MKLNQDLFQISKFPPEHITNVETYRPKNGNLCLKVISAEKMISKKYERKNIERLYGDFWLPLLTTDEEVLRVKEALLHLFKINGSPLIDENLSKD